jgi:hypothetical protein
MNLGVAAAVDTRTHVNGIPLVDLADDIHSQLMQAPHGRTHVYDHGDHGGVGNQWHTEVQTVLATQNVPGTPAVANYGPGLQATPGSTGNLNVYDLIRSEGATAVRPHFQPPVDADGFGQTLLLTVQRISQHHISPVDKQYYTNTPACVAAADRLVAAGDTMNPQQILAANAQVMANLVESPFGGAVGEPHVPAGSASPSNFCEILHKRRDIPTAGGGGGPGRFNHILGRTRNVIYHSEPVGVAAVRHRCHLLGMYAGKPHFNNHNNVGNQNPALTVELSNDVGDALIGLRQECIFRTALAARSVGFGFGLICGGYSHSLQMEPDSLSLPFLKALRVNALDINRISHLNRDNANHRMTFCPLSQFVMGTEDRINQQHSSKTEGQAFAPRIINSIRNVMDLN